MKIKIKSVKNIRDFSQYGCDGYIRCAHLAALSPEDAEILTKRYHLKTIIDLRTSKETQEKPDAKIEGVSYVHIPIFEDSIPGISHERETDEFHKMIPHMPDMYALIATKEPYVSQIRKVMRIIEDKEREGAVLWHCTEGKDRCGIVSALFLLSRGVNRKEVIKDYLRTNKTNRTKAWKYYFLIWLSQKSRKPAALVRDAYLAKRRYIEPILDRLEEMAKEEK